MAFVNERITGNDWERYNIPEIRRRIMYGERVGPNTCTIDHERGIYLLDPAERHEERPNLNGFWPTGFCGWVFMWHGHELWVEGKLTWKGESRGHGWGHLRLTSLGLMGNDVRSLGDPGRLPPELMPHRDEILKDLYDALLVYRVSGIFSKFTSYDLQLELVEGV